LPADTCSQIREGLKSDNSDLVRMEINNICKGLNGFVVKDNLQKLTSIISSGCKINATLLCTECIQTLPPQSEIKISFSLSGTQYSKTIDILSGYPLKCVGMHE